MSRSTVAKSRAEKGGKSATTATPAITHEIVSGKLNDQDWNAMLDVDEGDDFIIDIVEDVCSTALDIIFSNYIENQLVPYTVLQAKDAIIQIIEWQFLSRDEGEKGIDNDPGWVQDEEPEPAVTDCWAQGSVPRIIVKSQTPDIMTPNPLDNEGLEQIQEENTLEVAAAEEGDLAEISDDSLPVEEINEEKEESTVPADKEVEELPEKEQIPSCSEKKTGTYKRYRGKLNMDSLSKLTESLDEVKKEGVDCPPTLGSPDLASYQMPSSCQSLLKLQAGRPPGHHDVVYDEYGNVMGITKINVQKLPSHKVKTGFVVVDPSVEAAQSRLEAMRTGRYVKAADRSRAKISPRPPGSPRSSKTSTTIVRSSQTSISSKMHHSLGGSTHEGMSGLPPPLIEAMEVSPGVEVREGDRVKTGPRQHTKKMDLTSLTTQHQLRPIRSKANIPTISVMDLLAQHTPLVKPIADTMPIPPIHSPQMSS